MATASSASSAQSLLLLSILEIIDKAILFIDLHHCDGPRYTNEGRLFRVARVKGKGFGLLALRDIRAFELILIDKALLFDPEPSDDDATDSRTLSEHLQAQFAALSEAQRRRVLALSNCASNAQRFASSLEGIFQTNCVGTTDSAAMRSALFPRFARTNHRCVPNCAVFFEAAPTQCIVLKAIARIDRGAELSVCHIPRLLRTFAERQQRLEGEYGFVCDCAAL